MLLMLSLLNLGTPAMAKDLPGEELFSSSQKKEAEATPTKAKRSNTHNTTILPRNTQDANLPSVYLAGLHRQSTSSELILPPKGSVDILRSLKVGDKLTATVNHSVIAFSDEKAPVVAELTSRNLKGIKLIGESRLEKNSKRIFIEFTRAVQNGKIYNLKATALTDVGVPGFEGEYHSRELEYFSGDFISSFVAAYFDGLVPRTRNAFGQTEEDTSVDSAMKKGMAAGSMSSSERFREKLKHTPEFSELQGPFDLNILILDDPKTN